MLFCVLFCTYLPEPDLLKASSWMLCWGQGWEHRSEKYSSLQELATGVLPNSRHLSGNGRIRGCYGAVSALLLPICPAPAPAPLCFPAGLWTDTRPCPHLSQGVTAMNVTEEVTYLQTIAFQGMPKEQMQGTTPVLWASYSSKFCPLYYISFSV